MISVIKQFFTANITPLSRYGLGYDTIHIETVFETDQPIPSDQYWYMPNGSDIPPYIIDLIKKSGNQIPYLYPISASYLDDVADVKEQALGSNEIEVLKDVSKLLLVSVLKKINFTPLTGNVYMLSYDIKVAADQAGNFNFKFVIPVDGLKSENINQITVDVVLPISATLNPSLTQGQDPTGNIIEETTTATSTNRIIVSFKYNKDPNFVVSYRY